MKKMITVIGNSVMDVMARPVTPEVFLTGSCPVQETRLTFGGDGLNEAVVLARFGKKPRLISKVGQDEAGTRILHFMKDNGISADHVIVEPGIATSVNIVLIDGRGERYFLTNPQSSQRRLAKEDVLRQLEEMDSQNPQRENALLQERDIVSFASIFVSEKMNISAMTELFCRIKEKPGRILAADMTKAKHGERFADMKEFLPFIDYILPNEAEIALLTGEEDPHRNAELLNEAGVFCAVIKRGRQGCLIRTKDEMYEIPAWPVENCIDTTGAGDTFTAGFLWALSEGMPLAECGRFACAAASCVVECMGATDGILSLEEPMRRYREFAWRERKI